MDKYEFNIKVEQIKKLVNKGDYETAMKIADTIDWRRVRSANLLALIAEIYENNEEYQEAKEVLLLAFERAPIGKRLLYKLADLALKENNLREAEDYYREFCDLAPEDPRQYLLRYQILKAKKAPDEQLIHSLERFTNTELDEKWLYELAELYCRTGKEEECIQTCDKIMLMFGLGKYVDKAMKLKVQYAPLSTYQMDLIENRDKYEEKLRAVEQEFGDETREIMGEDYENAIRAAGSSLERRSEPQPDGEMYDSGGSPAKPDAGAGTPLRTYSKLIKEPEPGAGSPPAPAEPIRIVDEPAMAAEPTAEVEIPAEGSYQTMEEDLRARLHQEEAEKKVAREMSKISIQEYRKPESPMGQTKVIGSIREILTAYSSGPLPAVEQPAPASAARTSPRAGREDRILESVPVGREEIMRRAAEIDYLMIETRTPEKGLELAVEVLKRLHKEKGTKCPVVKITGSKLSRKGVMESSDKLADKDLIIEEAGDLTVVALIELEDLIQNSEIRVIMIDNPRQIEFMIRANPTIASMFTVITMKDDGELEIRKPIEPVEEAPAAVEPAAAAGGQMNYGPAAGAAVENMVMETPVMEQPVIQEPAVTEPVMTGPVMSQPVMAQPVMTEPVVAEPVITEPVITEPVVTEGVVEKPVAAEPVITEPVIQEPVVKEPVMQEAVAEAAASQIVVEETTMEEPVIAASVTKEAEAEEPVAQTEAAASSVEVSAEETSGESAEKTAISVEEPAAASDDNTAAAMAEFMKLMESVMEEEPTNKKPAPEEKQDDNTAAVMAEFMRLMENAMEEPAAAPAPAEEEQPEKQQEESAAPFESSEPVAAPEIPMTPVMQTIQPENPMAAAMAAATAVPVGMAGTPVTPIMPTMTTATAVPVNMAGIPVTPVIMQPVQSIPQPVNNIAAMGSDEEMELHDFVEYTCKYASDIDCSITGKSMLALYERIEVMEENGIPLTKINAENLIEEAADKAEKFSFKKLFTGLFHPRYDKEGLLILREEHFMN